MSPRSTAEQLIAVRETIKSAQPDVAFAQLRTIFQANRMRPEIYGNISDLTTAPDFRTKSLPSVRIAILGTDTTQPIATAMRCALLAEGVVAEIYETPFGAYRQEILAPDSGLYAFNPDAVVIAAGLSGIENLPRTSLADDAVDAALEQEVGYWRSIWDILETRLGKPILQHTFEVPGDEFLGVSERRARWTPYRFVELLNYRLLDVAPGNVKWIDVDRLAARIGRHNWRDLRLYYHGKLPFSPRFLPDYSLLLSAAWRDIMGQTKKALAIDLDNTLWGGVIGDDGIDGIKLGLGSAEGEAYMSFCTYVLGLKRRGVILVACSKNDRVTAAEVFERHPHMPLKLGDFAAFQCNWDDKATNLSLIARDLNIDISSFVFVDDNPAECELVRQKLPDVAVIHLAGDPAEFPRILDRQHFFDTPVFSGEDFHRTESYVARTKATELLAQAPDLESYLRSLEMTATIVRAKPEDIPRLAQMEMKTNQFNLTTRRLTKQDIEQSCENPDAIVLTLSLKDRFANHGLVAYLTAVNERGALRISDWIMSCRVFSRTAEYFFFNYLLSYAKGEGISTIVGEFRTTSKNAVVSDLYSRLGFDAMPGDLGRWWSLSIASARPQLTFISEPRTVMSGQA